MRVLRVHCTDNNEQVLLRAKMKDLNKYDVIITTYEMITISGLSHTFKTMYFRALILDEGHKIKNEKTDSAIACHRIKAQFKVILTGTPLQNNLHELGSLLSFLLPGIFTDLTLFDNAFQLNGRNRSTSVEQSGTVINRSLLEQAHYLLRLFQLRRLKVEVEQNLPLKLETKIECPMSPLQKEITQFLLFQERKLLEKIESKLQQHQSNHEEKVTLSGNERASVMGLLAHLRKAANHPFLFPGIETPEFDGRATEEIVSASGKMIILDKLLRKLKAKGHRVVLFSQFTKTLDILCDYLDLRGYKYGRLDGATNRVMREVQISLYNNEDSDLYIFCLTTRAGGMGVNLCSADTVILFDSDWNPQVDIQAMARVHRIGQTKPVHVYRLITKGTVDESIVHRAQKKLFLDSMVNRGSTSNALALDKIKARENKENSSTKQSSSKKRKSRDPNDENDEDDVNLEELEEDLDPKGDNNEEELDEEEIENKQRLQDDNLLKEEDTGKIYSLLKFGWNAVFSTSNNSNNDGKDSELLTDEDLEWILDRSRGINDVIESKGKEEDSTTMKNSHLLEDQQTSIDNFDENAPLVSIDTLRQNTLVDLEKELTETVAKEKKIALISTDDVQEVKESAENNTYDLKKSRSEIDPNLILSNKRIRTTRLTDVYVEGVGEVSVLNENNGKYEKIPRKYVSKTDILAEFIAKKKLNDAKNNTGQKKKQESMFVVGSHSTRQLAGRDYRHQDICQICWDGGELIVCDNCPCVYHLECLGLKTIPEGKIKWFCPHHSCCKCLKKGSAVGFLFRCEICEHAYCEDCVPDKAKILGECKRFTALGFRWPANACYIRCSPECIVFPAEEYYHAANLQEGGEEVEEDDEEFIEEGGESHLIKTPERGNLRSPEYKKLVAKKKSSSAAKQSSSQQHNKEKDKKSQQKAATKSSSSAIASNSLMPLSSSSLSSSNLQKGKEFESLDFCALKDIKYRLFRDDSTLSIRFLNLLEVPNILSRYEKAPPHVKSVFLHLLNFISKSNERIIIEDDKNNNKLLTNNDNNVDESDEDNKMDETNDHVGEEDSKEIFRKFSGMKPEHTNYMKLKLFLKVLNIITSIDKYIIPKIGQMIGIVELSKKAGKIRFK